MYAGMSTEKFVPGVRSSGFYTVVRDTCTSDRVSGGVDGGPELYVRMYSASGLDSTSTAELEDERKSIKDIYRERKGGRKNKKRERRRRREARKRS